ncbi:DNA binding domain-containing protein [Haloferax larsenii JCM 13917]|nr:helix-turn-helix domain-containing protein [Haloferax larsenii]ELZ82142.1 DNA binding domain-containing protein [Haloferax larsenii JCM 13917]
MVSVIADIRVAGPSAVLTQHTLRELPEAEIRIQYQGSSEKAGLVVRECDFDEFESKVETDPSIGSYEHVADFSDVRVYNITAGDVPTLVSEHLASKNIQVLEATSPSGDSNWQLRVRSPSRKNLADVLSECRRGGNSIQLNTLYSETNPPDEANFGCPSMDRLTDDQYDALVAAYESGYFEIPKGTSLAQLSQQFDIGSQAMSERLRRAMNTMLESHLQQDVAKAEH